MTTNIIEKLVYMSCCDWKPMLMSHDGVPKFYKKKNTNFPYKFF